MKRFVLIAAVVFVGIIVTPYGLNPAFNSADLVAASTPIAVAAIGLSGRSRTVREHETHWFVEHIGEDHPDGLGSLDLAERRARHR